MRVGDLIWVVRCTTFDYDPNGQTRVYPKGTHWDGLGIVLSQETDTGEDAMAHVLLGDAGVVWVAKSNLDELPQC